MEQICVFSVRSQITAGIRATFGRILFEEQWQILATGTVLKDLPFVLRYKGAACL